MKKKNMTRLMAIALLLLSFGAGQALAFTHVVKRGETIYGIAHQYKIPVDRIIEMNPHAVDGVKKDMVLTLPDPVNSEAAEAAKSDSAQHIEIQEKDSKKAKSKAEKSKTKQDKSKTKPNKSTEKPSVEVPTSTSETVSSELISYLSKPGDTFESISKQFGISEDKLIELNPFVDPIRIYPSTQIRLRDDAPLDIYADMRAAKYEEWLKKQKENAEEQTAEDQTVEEDAEAIEEEVEENSEEEDQDMDSNRNIMLLLPFMSESEAPSKRAKQYADFYRGFLIAANELKNSGTNDVEILALDTNDDAGRIRKQLSNTTDRNLAIIIAPEEEKQLKEVIDFATPQGIYVLNIFDIKDESYKGNQYVLQGNINQSLMYKKAIEALLEDFDGYVPVVLTQAGARAEKEPFVAALRKRCLEQDIEVIDIEYQEALTDEDLAALDPEKKYVFIPRSGSLSVFNSFAPALYEYKTKSSGDNIGVFGYPDWTMFRGEALENLYNLNAVIYSRFDINIDSPAVSQLQEEFVHWYGNPMIEAVPLQGALGYDIAYMLLGVLQNGNIGDLLERKHREGVQSAFDFRHNDGSAGYVNSALYIITFQPTRTVSVKVS